MESQVLKSGCEKLGIFLNEKQESQFIEYYKMLIEWNQVMNLTAITEYDEVMQKHFVDSLSLVKGIDLSSCEKLIDIGTGAGFPGIPLKIVFPHLKIVLLDSLGKRVKFLNAVVGKLGLDNSIAIHGRAEDFSRQKEYREKFDICVSRAVANLSSLSEYCIPYVKVGGTFISYKSGAVEGELKNAQKAISILGGEEKQTLKFVLPDSDIERALVIIQKKKETPRKYPRKAGVPGKEPL